MPCQHISWWKLDGEVKKLISALTRLTLKSLPTFFTSKQVVYGSDASHQRSCQKNERFFYHPLQLILAENGFVCRSGWLWLLLPDG
jgi:secreted Zn-dependent insulinase-like peptidase